MHALMPQDGNWQQELGCALVMESAEGATWSIRTSASDGLGNSI
jgi:hypothetical protein